MQNTLPRRIAGRLALLCLALALSATSAQSRHNAQNNAVPAAAVQIIPQPKQLSLTGDMFHLGRDVRVVLADPRSVEDRFAAQDFLDDLKETAGLSLPVGGARGRRTILIGTLGLAPVQSALKRAGLDAPANLDQEGYLLIVTPGEVLVAGKTATGTFYGLQTLKQLVRGDGAEAYIQGVRITDWPTMRWRGVSDDISRGPIPTVGYIKRQLHAFAAFKLNMHSFYMEHTFASESHPLIAPEGGALTPPEIRELVAYARALHIELVPEQQTFGHLHKALKLEKYNELAETPYGDVLSPQQPGSYKLVADLYRELDQLFPGQFFHIGSDETFELGQGQSSAAVRERGVGAVYFEHLNRVRDILLPYKRRLMFWGDIATNHPELLGRVPHEMIVMNWNYNPKADYAKLLKPFKDAGLDQFVCPGVQNWNQIFPNTDAAVLNIPKFVGEGQAAGALGMMNTSWDDDGESLFEMTWYAVGLGAAASWGSGPLDADAFDRNFDWTFFRSEGDRFTRVIRDLGHVNSLLDIRSSDQLFWQDPWNSAYQEHVRELNEKTRQMRLMVEADAETLLREKAHARRNSSMIPAMLFAARRFDHLGRRMETVEKFSRDYWTAYLNLGDKVRVRRLSRYSGAIYNNLREMAEELSLLREDYRQRWLSENRPYWLDSILARYDLAINNWLAKSKAVEEALREYNENSTLPNPEEFGLGPKPEERQK